ncbi:Protein doublesex [Eumeta japonica]|uniref:Protein doublesex n=1 Tax=Eumeta variegata TaxID=151549 RepID=A0A4C2A374_EUMVA|nr:Protein doublesex [Eumeta japonica]
MSLETMLENCNKLLEKFHYSWEMMPLVLVILNYAGSDLEEASRKIDEVCGRVLCGAVLNAVCTSLGGRLRGAPHTAPGKNKYKFLILAHNSTSKPILMRGLLSERSRIPAVGLYFWPIRGGGRSPWTPEWYREDPKAFD